MATSRKPLRSSRSTTSPTRPRSTASGLHRTRVRSTATDDLQGAFRREFYLRGRSYRPRSAKVPKPAGAIWTRFGLGQGAAGARGSGGPGTHQQLPGLAHSVDRAGDPHSLGLARLVDGAAHGG